MADLAAEEGVLEAGGRSCGCSRAWGRSWRRRLLWSLQLRPKGKTDAADGEGDAADGEGAAAGRLVGDL
jgi:hypothetical protein